MTSILVVDDTPLILQMIVEALTLDTNYKIYTAMNGNEALGKIPKYMPDIVLLDIEMPGLSGFDILESVRKEEKYDDIDFIIITSRGSIEDRVKGLKLGASDYIVKPFNPDELLARVQTHIRIKELKEKLIESEKWKLLGQMAVTLRHEINNPLTSIMGNLELLMSTETSGEELTETLKLIQQSAKRIEEVIRKVTEIEKIVTKDYVAGIKMLDIDPSDQKE